MTRYPKSGKGRKWTILELKSIPVSWKGDSLSDGEGLSGEVRIGEAGAASVRFKYAYRWEGKVQWFQAGTWPANSLEEIRAARDAARKAVKDGVNPTAQKRAERIAKQERIEAQLLLDSEKSAADLPFSKMYEAWITHGVVRVDGNKEIKRSFAKDVLPFLGTKPVRQVAEADLREIVSRVSERGANRMAVRLHDDLVQLFAWSQLRQPWRKLMTEGNPAQLLEISKIVSSKYLLNTERDRILTANEIRELRTKLDALENAYRRAPKKYEAVRPLKRESQLALWILPGTACRIGELLKAKWEDVNLRSGAWRIPVENVKRTRAKQHDHIVYLSPFVIRQFEDLKAATGDQEWCFPARHKNETHVSDKSVSKQVGDRQSQFRTGRTLKNRRQDNTLVLNEGKSGEWTPHDLRRTAATMMQAMGVNLDVIDRCQGHVLTGSRVRRHYLHHDYAEEKRGAWELLGTRIVEILGTAPT